MSGGSLGYVYAHVNDARVRLRERREQIMARRAEWDEWEHATFPKALARYEALESHLALVSAALYEVEWALSGDTHIGCDRERVAIAAVLGREVAP